MYEEYFGLDRPPFKITPDTSLFFDGGRRGDVLAALVYAIHRGEGIIKVVGEVGSGKTMLCRMLQLRLPDNVEIVYIANPSVSPEDILFVIAHELEFQVAKDASKHEVMHMLQDYLLKRHIEDKQVVLFVEEAQGMPLETLEEIRLLSNLETDQNKLLQIILFGQPELDENLAEQSIRQLRERITHSFNLMPLSTEEIRSYLNFRMREVGFTGPELIDEAVARKVEQYSRGLLRRINIIADKILLSAFAEGTHNLTPKHVLAAVEDSSFDQKRGKRRHRFDSGPLLRWGLAALLVVALAVGAFSSREAWLTPLRQIDVVALVDRLTPAAAEPQTIAEAPAGVEASSDPAPAPAVETVAHIAVEAEAEIAPAVTVTPVENKPAVDAALVQKVEDMVQEVEAAVQKAEQRKPVTIEVAARDNGDQQLRNAIHEAATNVTVPMDSLDYDAWLNAKLQQSRDWLDRADRSKVSIQVMMRSKSAARELVVYLRTEWPLDLSKTYLYEVSTRNRSIYRVFYSEYDSLAQGRSGIESLPDSVKANSPYLNSVHRMKKALL